MHIGRPKPQYQWLKDGKALTEFRDDEIYKILDAKKSDSGFYQCLARNDAGTIFSNKSEVVVACKRLSYFLIKLNNDTIINHDIHRYGQFRE